MTTGFATPAWRVVLDGTDLTERIAPRLLGLTLTECRGGEADQLDLQIHDHDGKMALPKRGVTLTVSIGTQQAGMVGKGTFRVDEVEYSGAPDIITIRARSADLTDDMRVRRDKSWHDTTLGDVLRDIAGRHGITAKVDAALAKTALKQLQQANESDINLITRLGKRYDAVATVKAGALLFAPIGSGTTPSGKALPTLTITRADGDQHRYSTTDRNAYSGVRAYWTDKAGANRKSVLVGESGNAKRLRESYASEKVAREMAEAEWKRLQRGESTLGYTLAIGNAAIYPEMHVRVSGFKPEIDDTQWLVAKATHTLSGSSGYTTALELETLGAAQDDDDSETSPGT